MSLLPQIKSLTENQKTQLYLEFLNAIQRVKHFSSVPPANNTPINHPFSYISQQPPSSLGHHYTTNNIPQNVPSSISIHRPLLYDIPSQYDSQNVPATIINSTISRSPSESTNPNSSIKLTQKENYYHPEKMSTPPTPNLHHYINNYSQPIPPNNSNKKIQ